MGLAAGKKGAEKVMSLTDARDQAWGLAQLAKKHGMNPKDVCDQIEASELTFGQVWETYLKYLKSKQPPIKPNSELSLNKARQKFKDWEQRKVGLISAKEVLDRFDHHAVEMKHRTAAEAMGR